MMRKTLERISVVLPSKNVAARNQHRGSRYLAGGLAICLGMIGWNTATIAGTAEKPDAFADLELPYHQYWDRELTDPFTYYIDQIKAGEIAISATNEQEFLEQLLTTLGISKHSQLLLFSTTSLQLSLIKPENPRAIYFNESIYVGYIPGGQFEIVSIDPHLGAVFFIFDVPFDQGKIAPQQLEFIRSERCMNCHALEATGHVPGVVLKSVLPGVRGGSIDAFRRDETGHHIPLSDRFGGWHLTTELEGVSHYANQIGRYEKGEIRAILNPYGQNFDPSMFPAPGSDLLPHLILEHQAGWINRCVEAAYRARHYTQGGVVALSPEHQAMMEGQAKALVRYLLFADEASLPAQKLAVDEAYRADFLEPAKRAASGKSLRDLNLQGRLFEHRCSYMIYEPVFTTLPDWFRRLVYAELDQALGTERSDYHFMSQDEKSVIRSILDETLSDPLYSKSR